MAENDIYGSKGKYEEFKKNLDRFKLNPSKRKGNCKYFCKNPDNLEYFRKLFIHFEAKDLSYIRRIRVLQTMRFISYSTVKNFSDCGRDDINQIMANMHNIYITPISKETFIKDLKHIWKILFPETDEKGRPDETIVPYAVRHLAGKSDKSREKLRKDKFTWEEFEKILNYFSNDSRMQCYLTLSLESLARPQELLYLRIGNIELHQNYARIFISEHGKEGVGLLQCIDSYPYLLKCLESHPLKQDKNAFLFINTGTTNRCKQLKPSNINKMISIACKELQINKPITCYSLKRNGVTIRRLRGESDVEIQHAARWSDPGRLKTYDLSSQDEAFKLALQKRGIIKTDKNSGELLKTKTCHFCNETVGFGEIICPKCRHPLDREIAVNEIKKDDEIHRLKQSISSMQTQFENIKSELMQELTQEIMKAKSR